MAKFFSFPLLVAAVSGVFMAVQGTLNSQLSSKTSLLTSTFAVHIIGSLLALIALLWTRTPFFTYSWSKIPWYLYLGGILSVFIIGLVAFSIQKNGVCNATTAIIIGQVAAAIVIDHFGLFGTQKLAWNPWQLLGVVLFAAGAKLLFR